MVANIVSTAFVTDIATVTGVVAAASVATGVDSGVAAIT